MKVVLEVEKANQLLQYLASKPYAEVYQLVAILQQAPKVEDEVKPLEVVKE